jgi:hypothetical protein
MASIQRTNPVRDLDRASMISNRAETRRLARFLCRFRVPPPNYFTARFCLSLYCTGPHSRDALLRDVNKPIKPKILSVFYWRQRLKSPPGPPLIRFL